MHSRCSCQVVANKTQIIPFIVRIHYPLVPMHICIASLIYPDKNECSALRPRQPRTHAWMHVTAWFSTKSCHSTELLTDISETNDWIDAAEPGRTPPPAAAAIALSATRSNSGGA